MEAQALPVAMSTRKHARAVLALEGANVSRIVENDDAMGRYCSRVPWRVLFRLCFRLASVIPLIDNFHQLVGLGLWSRRAVI